MIHRMMELERGPPFHFTDEKIEASKAKCLYLKVSYFSTRQTRKRKTGLQDHLSIHSPNSKEVIILKFKRRV